MNLLGSVISQARAGNNTFTRRGEHRSPFDVAGPVDSSGHPVLGDQLDCRLLVSVDDGGPVQGGGDPTRLLSHPGCCGGIRQHTPERSRQGGRIAVRHNDAGAAAEQLDCMREGGGDYRLAGGDSFHQHSRRDLFGRGVWKDHHIGSTNREGQSVEVEVPSVELDDVP